MWHILVSRLPKRIADLSGLRISSVSSRASASIVGEDQVIRKSAKLAKSGLVSL